MGSTAWPDQCLETTRVLVAEGRSASAIAAELWSRFGFSASRNAVIGQIERRKGNEGWPPKRARTKAPAHPRAKRPQRSRRGWLMPGTPAAPAPKGFRTTTKAEGAAYDAASRRVPLADVEADQCHFPVTDAERGETFLFCGLPAETKRYCSHHHNRAYQPL